MNKKIITLLLSIFCIITVVLISVLGKVPESSSRIKVESIEFVDSRIQLNESNEKYIFLDKGISEYQLKYKLNPEKPTDTDVTFAIISEAEHANISKDGLITFNTEAQIIVRIWSNFLDNKTDTLIIDFKVSSGDPIDIDW